MQADPDIPENVLPLSKPQVVAGVTRLPFLSLAVVCVILGGSLAWISGADLSVWRVVLVLVAALSSHAAVNVLNEYHDFRSGLDLNTRRTPFSGGSGTLPRAPHYENLARWLGIGFSATTIVIGVYLSLTSHPLLLLLGLLGLLLIWFYTGPLNRQPVLCLLAPGLGFGICIVIGTEIALSGSLSTAGLVAGLHVACLASGLLLLNQFPDREADAGAGRRHLIIRYGYRAGATVFALLLIVSYLLVITGVVMQWLNAGALLSLLTAPLLLKILPPVLKTPENHEALIPAMGQNVLLVNLSPLLLAIGLLI